MAISLEHKIKELEKAKSLLNNAIDEVYEAGLNSQSMNNFFDLRQAIEIEIRTIEDKIKDLRIKGEPSAES